MPSKRQTLASAMLNKIEISPEPQAEAKENPQSSLPIHSSRKDKKFIGGYFAPEVSKQLKILSAKTECSHQELVGEALNLLFEKYGENLIA